MGKRISSIGRYILRHKYFWTILLFILVVGFLDSNSMLHRYNLHAENEAVRDEIAKYDKEYAKTSADLEDLMSSNEAIEIVARENLMMKKADEDVYEVITTEE